jgi:hypothetical protein
LPNRQGASPITRASLSAVALINFFNMMFMLYVVRWLHVAPERSAW